MTRILLLACLVWALGARVGMAATSLWGYSGLATMPDAEVAPHRELELGARWILLPQVPVALLGFARYGVLESLETSLVYGVPGYPYLTGSLKYQLMRPTSANPTAVALGATLLGVPAKGTVAGTEYFLAVSRALSLAQGGRTLNLGTLHLGFEGDAALNARLMVGLSLPLGALSQVLVEGRGPQSGALPFAHVGFEVAPLPWLRLDAASLGDPTETTWNRGFFAGASAHGIVPDFVRPLNRATGPSVPHASAPVAPAPNSSVSPPPLPTATLVGRVLGPHDAPEPNYQVLLVNANERATTTLSGYFFFSALAPGRYTLRVSAPSGQVEAEQGVEVLGSGLVPVTVHVGRSK